MRPRFLITVAIVPLTARLHLGQDLAAALLGALADVSRVVQQLGILRLARVDLGSHRDIADLFNLVDAGCLGERTPPDGLFASGRPGGRVRACARLAGSPAASALLASIAARQHPPDARHASSTSWRLDSAGAAAAGMAAREAAALPGRSLASCAAGREYLRQAEDAGDKAASSTTAASRSRARTASAAN